ncbi:tyrosine--tRNA ligase [Candidatus Gracilibacteria bacterium]|nr:MAG: tyrosine--tRNA ligase [Candidatus Gracilibacteria bacterium]PIE85319.1 MAG: tyrosine--tRNA ligase [Candidatus Gracilibacteria bacterium]
MISLKKELEDRGFLHQYTDEKVFEIFEKGGNNFYFGVDCSSNSMTIGNFVALQMAIKFMLKGNKCFLLVGGATSTIGNPSGKDSERPILGKEILQANQKGIASQFDKLVKNVENITGKKLSYEIVNNYDFFKNMNILTFLKEVGRFMTVNWMMSKDIVKKRITDPNKFISYAEFSYMLIMGYDFYHLNKYNNVILEVGGSDEWDGILSGIELVGKKSNKEVYGVTNKLIMDANGKKFGKSEGNAIWLDENKTSPYQMYQYFMNSLDEDIGKYLKLFSFLEINEINEIVEKHFESPEKREGQKILAYKVVEIIHGTNEANLAKNISNFMFSGSEDRIKFLESSTDHEIKTICNAIGGYEYKNENLFETIVKSGLAKSSSEVRQAIKSGAISINEERISDFNHDFSQSFINNKVLLIRKGKKNLKIIYK